MSSMFPWQAAPTVNNNNTRPSLLQSGVSNALAAQLGLSSSTSNYKNVNLTQAIPSSTATMNMQFTPINRPAYTTNTINGLPPRTATSFGGSLGTWRQPLGVVRPAPSPVRTHQIIASRVPRPYVPFAPPSGVVSSQPNNNNNNNNQTDDVNNRNALLVQDLLRQISVLQQQQQQQQQQTQQLQQQPRQSQQYSFGSNNNANNNSASINMQYVSQPVVSAPAAVPIQQIIQAAAAAAAANSNNNSNFTQFARTNGNLINNNISNYQTPMMTNTPRRQTNFIPQVSAAVVPPPSEATKITTFNHQSGSTTSTLLTSVTLERLQAALNSASSLNPQQQQQQQPQQLQHTFASLLQKPLHQQQQRSQQQQQQEAKSGKHATLYQSDQPASLPISTTITNNPPPPPVVSSASYNSINNRNYMKAAATTTTTPPKSMRQLVNAQPSSSLSSSATSNNVRTVKSSLGEASTASFTASTTTSPHFLYRTPRPPYNTNSPINIAEPQHQTQTGSASPSMAERVAILDAILNGNHSNHEKLALLQHHQRQQQQQQQQQQSRPSSTTSKHGEDQTKIMQLAQQILQPPAAAAAPVSAPSSATPPLIMNISPTPNSNIISSTKNTTVTYSIINSCSPVPPSSSNKVVVSVSELQNQAQQQQRRQLVSSPAKKLSPALADLYGVVERQTSYDITNQVTSIGNAADADLQPTNIDKCATVNFEAHEGPPILPLGGCAADGFSSSTSNSKTSSSTTMPISPERPNPQHHHEQQQQQQQHSPVGSTSSSSSSSVQDGNPILTRMLTRIDEQKDADQALYRNLYCNTTTGSKPSKRTKEPHTGHPKLSLEDKPAQLTDAATGNNNEIQIIVAAAKCNHDAEKNSSMPTTSQLSVNAETIKKQQNIVGSLLTERAPQALTTTLAQQSQLMQQQQPPPPVPPLPSSDETLQEPTQERYEADEKPQPQPALQHLFRQRQLLLLNDSSGGNGSRRNSAPTTGIISSPGSIHPHNNSSGFYRSKLLAKAGWLEKMLRERLSQSESLQKNSAAAQATTTTNPVAEPTTVAISIVAATTTDIVAENDADSSKNDDKILPTPDLLKKLITDAASKISKHIIADSIVKNPDEISLKRKLADTDDDAADDNINVKVVATTVEAKSAVVVTVDDDDDDDVMPLDLSCFRSSAAEHFSTTNDKKPPQERQLSSAFLNENSTPAPLDFRILGTTDVVVPKTEDNEIIQRPVEVVRNNSIASSSANSNSGSSQKQFDYFDYNGQVPVSESTAAAAEAETTADNSLFVTADEVVLQKNDSNTSQKFKRTTVSRATSPIRWDEKRELRSIATQTDENDYKNSADKAKEEKYSYFKASSIQTTTSPAGRGGGGSSIGGGFTKQKARNPLGINGSANQRGKKRRRRIGGPRGAAGAAVHTRGYTPFVSPAAAQQHRTAAAAAASVPARWLPPPIPKFSMITPTINKVLPIVKRQRQSKKKQQQQIRQFQSMLNIDMGTTNNAAADADADDDIYAFADDYSKFGSTTTPTLKRKSYDDDSSICTLPSIHSSFSSSTTTTFRRRFTTSSTTSSSNIINAADAVAAAVDNNNHFTGSTTIQDIYSTVQDISPPPPPPPSPPVAATTTTTDSITIEIDGMPTLSAENEINFKDFGQQEIVAVKSSLSSVNAVLNAATSAVEANYDETATPTEAVAENLLICSAKLDESINRVAADVDAIVDDNVSDKTESATAGVYAEKPEDLTTLNKEAENPRWSYTMEELLPKAPRAVLSLLDNSSMLYFYKQAGPENMHRRNNPYRKYRCLGCDVKFIDRQCLAIHQQRIAFQLRFKCPVCCNNEQQLQESASAINNKACCNFNNECTFHEHIVEHLMRNETEILGLSDDRFEWL